MSFAYPTFADATAEYPIVVKLLKREPLDEPTKDVAHAVYVVAGVGLSVFPGAPVSFGAAPDHTYDAEAAASDLDRAFGQSAEFGAAPSGVASAIPWQLLLPILFQLLQEWLLKRG